MVLSNDIIFILSVSRVAVTVAAALGSLFTLKVYCLVLVEVHRRRALLSTGRFYFAL